MTDEQKNAIGHAQKILRAVKLYDLAAALESRVLAEREQKPVAWTLQSDLDAKESTYRAHLWFSNPKNTAWTPLFTHPTPDDASDAARYRWWRNWVFRAGNDGLPTCTYLAEVEEPADIDAAIDAAIQADKEAK